MVKRFSLRQAPRSLAVGLLCAVGWLLYEGGYHAVPAASVADERPDADEARRHVAGLWATSGWRLVEAGEYARAARAFTVARKLAPHEASYWVGLGLSQQRRFRDDLAMPALERAIQLDPHVAQAHVLLGDIYVQRGEVTAAVRYYEIALRQDPNDVAVQERLLHARRESPYDAPFDRLFSAHFIVKFQGGAARAVASLVAERLEVAYDEVGRTLGYFPDEIFTVILYPEGQFQSATLSPGWTRVLFDGRIHVPIEAVRQALNEPDAQGQGQGMTRMLKHEYAHAVVHRLSRGRAPVWLSEGLALYCEGMMKPGRMQAEGPTTGSTGREPLSSLHQSFTGLPPRAASAAYEESYEATRALIRRHGLSRVRQLLEALSTTPDFPRAFESVFHERYRDFDETWMSSQEGPQRGKKS